MASLNKVTLIGHLGKDPERRSMPSGDAITSATLATAEQWKDKKGEKQERTEWHRVVFFGRLAEIAGQYLHKGSQVYLEGSLRTRKWQDKEGQDRYTTDIVVSELKMLGARSAGQESGAAERAMPPQTITDHDESSHPVEAFEEEEIPF